MQVKTAAMAAVRVHVDSQASARWQEAPARPPPPPPPPPNAHLTSPVCVSILQSAL